MKPELEKLINDVKSTIKVHNSLKYAVRKLTDITSIAIHHSATSAGSASAFANYHVNDNGWPGIGYTYVIAKNGLIEWCNKWETVSYHVGNSNKASLGICLVGDFTKEKPTAEQLKSSYMLIEYLKNEIKSINSIKGHCEYPGYASKPCPAFNMLEYRDNYIEWTKLQSSSVATPTTPSSKVEADKRDIAIKISGEQVITAGLFAESTNYIPLRFFNMLGYIVMWNASKREITLITPEEIEILCRIVQAEAGGEDAKGKSLVAGVIMNRVQNAGFPNTIKEVVFQPMQFEPTRSGAYEKATISESTKKAVEEALTGTDYTQGALFFCSAASASNPVSWHESALSRLFLHGNHIFYK